LLVDIISVVASTLRLDRERQVHRHPVGVEPLADERVDADRIPPTSTGSNAWKPMRCVSVPPVPWTLLSPSRSLDLHRVLAMVLFVDFTGRTVGVVRLGDQLIAAVFLGNAGDLDSSAGMV